MVISTSRIDGYQLHKVTFASFVIDFKWVHGLGHADEAFSLPDIPIFADN